MFYWLVGPEDTTSSELLIFFSVFPKGKFVNRRLFGVIVVSNFIGQVCALSLFRSSKDCQL